MNAEQIRTENIRALIDQYGGNKEFCEAIGKKKSQVSQWANNSKASTTGKPITISPRSCRYIEKKLGLPENWMDVSHRSERLAAQIPSGESPRIGENSVPWYPRPDWKDVGNWEKPEKWFCCNADHSSDTFCITVRDMSLYAPNNTQATIIKGDIVFVDPNAPWNDGDYVFATSSHFKLASIKQYVIQGAEEYLFTPNPSWQQQWVPIDDTIKIHGKVVSVSRVME